MSRVLVPSPLGGALLAPLEARPARVDGARRGHGPFSEGGAGCLCASAGRDLCSRGCTGGMRLGRNGFLYPQQPGVGLDGARASQACRHVPGRSVLTPWMGAGCDTLCKARGTLALGAPVSLAMAALRATLRWRWVGIGTLRAPGTGGANRGHIVGGLSTTCRCARCRRRGRFDTGGAGLAREPGVRELVFQQTDR